MTTYYHITAPDGELVRGCQTARQLRAFGLSETDIRTVDTEGELFVYEEKGALAYTVTRADLEEE